MVEAPVRERTQGQLLPPSARPLAAHTAVAAGLVVLVLGAIFWHGTAPSVIDRAVARPLTDYYWHGHAVAVLHWADLGSPGPTFVLAGLVLVLGLARRRVRGALLLLLALPLASGLTEYVLKPLVHRTKDGVLAYPSGHSTGVFTLAFVVAILLIGPHRSVAGAVLRALTALASVMVAVVVAAALVASDFHYATDTVGGAGAALASVLSVSLALDALIDRRRTARE
jgi:membrane-associated phospholipid phosphatase